MTASPGRPPAHTVPVSAARFHCEDHGGAYFSSPVESGVQQTFRSGRDARSRTKRRQKSSPAMGGRGGRTPSLAGIAERGSGNGTSLSKCLRPGQNR